MTACYLPVLDRSRELCATFGLGDTAKGAELSLLDERRGFATSLLSQWYHGLIDRLYLCAMIAGLYLFFIFFGLVMLSLQIIVGALILYTTGHVPTIIQLARTHSVAPSLIVRRVASRK